MTTRQTWLIYTAILVPTLAILAFVTLRPIVVLPRITLAPGFALTEARRQRMTSEDMRGQLTFYTFVPWACPATCQHTLAALRTTQERLAEQTLDVPVRFVVVVLDAPAATPLALAPLADTLPAEWLVATAAPETLKRTVGGGFGVFYDANATPLKYDPAVMLVDGVGILRADYRTAQPDPATLLRDLGLIDQEVRNSTGLGALAYEAAHLFVCYPR